MSAKLKVNVTSQFKLRKKIFQRAKLSKAPWIEGFREISGTENYFQILAP